MVSRLQIQKLGPVLSIAAGPIAHLTRPTPQKLQLTASHETIQYYEHDICDVIFQLNTTFQFEAHIFPFYHHQLFNAMISS